MHPHSATRQAAVGARSTGATHFVAVAAATAAAGGLATVNATRRRRPTPPACSAAWWNTEPSQGLETPTSWRTQPGTGSTGSGPRNQGTSPRGGSRPYPTAQCWLDARGQHGRHGGRTPCSTPTMSLASSPLQYRHHHVRLRATCTASRLVRARARIQSASARTSDAGGASTSAMGCRVQQAGKRRRHRQHAPVAAAHVTRCLVRVLPGARAP